MKLMYFTSGCPKGKTISFKKTLLTRINEAEMFMKMTSGMIQTYCRNRNHTKITSTPTKTTTRPIKSQLDIVLIMAKNLHDLRGKVVVYLWFDFLGD